MTVKFNSCGEKWLRLANKNTDTKTYLAKRTNRKQKLNEKLQ